MTAEQLKTASMKIMKRSDKLEKGKGSKLAKEGANEGKGGKGAGAPQAGGRGAGGRAGRGAGPGAGGHTRTDIRARKPSVAAGTAAGLAARKAAGPSPKSPADRRSSVRPAM